MNEVSPGGLPSAAPELPPARVDGRRQRSVRTRQAILVAYLTLVQRSQRVPTVEQVAHEAKLSERAVFAHFSDREALAVAAFDQILSIRKSTPVGDLLSADRRARIRFQVEVRARNCEQWLPLWRVVVRGTANSNEVAERVERVRELTRARARLMYAAELDTLDESDRLSTLSAIESVIDYESWGRLRDHYKLSYDEACTAWIYAIDRLLPPTP